MIKRTFNKLLNVFHTTDGPKPDKRTPKEIASKKGEPWVAVLETHINKDNIRNGFFELDWNDQFVAKLKQEGYGFEGDPDEEIVGAPPQLGHRFPE